MCGSDVFLALIAILFPPLAVWVKRGLCSVDSLINIALCCLGFLPGLLHAWYVIASSPEPTYEELQDPERANTVTYYYVQQGAGGPQYTRQDGTGRSYGTVNAAPSSQFPQGGQQGFVQPPPQQGSSSEDVQPPPTYQQAVTGDNKVQRP
ncbi:hypothetical protein LTR62_000965 [Meristemomyces frigidus]|uniref:Stress response RCI peptide n=1 Tax=Meristemomyces frigidus TaxID=1508187 RepID=A0AAN7YLB5_9PEZI|nr:hypothetical protein LTR62_000965 [Meristemomyces frigidus]